jgi:O-succinylbenzoic acid--CoA ligase
MSETITCPIFYFAGQIPSSPALISGTKTYSYRQLDEMVSSFTEKFLQEGIGAGTRVALSMRNSPTYIAILSALWRIGATAVPIDFHFPAEYRERIFNRLAIRYYILREYKTPIEEFAGKGTGHEPIIRLENEATIVLTSGSTFVEKPVLHTYGNHYYNAFGSNRNIHLEPGDRWLLSLPLYHVGGLGIQFRSFLAGAAVVIPQLREPLEESIRKHSVTHVSLVSTQLYRLLERMGPAGPGRLTDALSSLKALLLGGSAFPESLIRKALVLKLPIFTSYGLSEMASQVTTTPPGAPAEKLLTSGKPLKFRNLKIDQSGEIHVSGPTRFKGYLEEQCLFQPFDSEGWFATGDLGSIDADGYLQVLGRKDNMFISGGENIMPEEIEARINEIPELEQSVVVPVEDRVYGFRPVAFLKTRSPGLLNKEYVIDRLQQKLPRFKIPDVFYLWPAEADESSLKIKRPFFSTLIEDPEKLTKLTLLFKK